MNIIILIVLLITGGYDLYLALTTGDTLSKKYQRLFPRVIDTVFFAAGIAAVVLLQGVLPQVWFFLWAIILAFWGHITFPNKETYVKK